MLKNENTKNDQAQEHTKHSHVQELALEYLRSRMLKKVIQELEFKFQIRDFS